MQKTGYHDVLSNKRLQSDKVPATYKLMSRLIYLIAVVTGTLLLPMSHATENDEAIKELREMIFNLDPNEIGITQDKLNHPVWGMVMETGFENGSFTFVTLADGTTSLYFSTGGGTIGPGM